MNAAIDVGQDFQAFDNPQTITLQPRGGSPQSVAGATPSTLSERELESTAGSLGVDNQYRAFSLPVAHLSGAVPGNGDLVIDAADNTWLVQSVSLATLSTRYRVVCVKQKG